VLVGNAKKVSCSKPGPMSCMLQVEATAMLTDEAQERLWSGLHRDRLLLAVEWHVEGKMSDVAAIQEQETTLNGKTKGWRHKAAAF